VEIDCFLAQILGARDSFLFQINQKLELGVDDKNVELGSVQAELSKEGKGKLKRCKNLFYLQEKIQSKSRKDNSRNRGRKNEEVISYLHRS
jgi:hypothetical protein